MKSTLTSRQSGYILLTLLLIMSLLVIGAAVAAPTIARQIQRDREEEMIHRAAQYRRAVREFMKHRGRYPTTIDELVQSDGIRYLRKHYKDPITGKEFRLLHATDLPGAIAAGSRPLLGANSSSGQDPNSPSTAIPSAVQGQAQAQAQPQAQAQNPDNGDPSQTPTASGTSGQESSQAGASSSPGNQQVFGGGPIVGVASSSTKPTIREFERKNHYNQWLFFYDPGFDRRAEIWGPTPSTRMPAYTGADATPAADSSSQSPNPPQQQ